MRGIGCVVLAAGGSTRLGQPKQLIDLRGEPLVCAAVRAAQQAGCDPVCVVTGHVREAVERAVAPLHPRLAYNGTWAFGMGGSIRLGLQALQPVSAVILLACDQPAVDAAVLRALIEHHRRTGRAIVASHYSGTMGIPALFDQSCFGELQRLPDASGAKAIIQALPERVVAVDFPGGALDLDSEADLRAWRARTDEG